MCVFLFDYFLLSREVEILVRDISLFILCIVLIIIIKKAIFRCENLLYPSHSMQ